MQKVFRTRRRKVVAVLVVLALAVASAALAGWIVSSQGKAAGKGGQLVAPSFFMATDAEIGSGDLMPGGTGSVWVKVTNPNPVALYVKTVRANVAAAPAISTPPACPNTNVSFLPNAGAVNYTQADNGGPGGTALKVNANADGQLVRLPRVLSMSASAPDGCQGAYLEVIHTSGSSPTPVVLDFDTAVPAP